MLCVGRHLAMSDVALIYPYFRTHARNELLFHPLGIAQLTALLRRERVDTLVVDCTFRQREEVLADLEAAAPRIIGIYVMVSMSENARGLARDVRRRLPDALLVCGGPLPTLTPDRFCREFDLVFRGEAVGSFPRFCADYIGGSWRNADRSCFCENAGAYPGLYGQRRDADAPYQSQLETSSAARLNMLPIADRSDYDHAGYHRFWADKGTFSLATVMTTYGCPHNCDFCSRPVFGNMFRRRDTDKVVEEIRDVQERGYEGVWIADDCFTLDVDHMRRFCRRMIREGLDLKWTCLSRVDKMIAADVILMRDAGCERVYFGLESASNEILRVMNKKTTVEAAEETVHQFSRSGIKTAGFFIVGYPGETYETVERTFAWALSLPLDEISFTVPYPLPGTGLFERVGKIEEDADWRCENENRILYESEFDEEYLRKRIADTYAQFESNRRAVAR